MAVTAVIILKVDQAVMMSLYIQYKIHDEIFFRKIEEHLENGETEKALNGLRIYKNGNLENIRSFRLFLEEGIFSRKYKNIIDEAVSIERGGGEQSKTQ
jgi:hypothetical protein